MSTEMFFGYMRTNVSCDLRKKVQNRLYDQLDDLGSGRKQMFDMTNRRYL